MTVPERDSTNPQSAAAQVDRCPACKGIQFVLTGSYCNGFETRLGEQVFNQPSYAIGDCLECGYLFKTYTASTDELDRYYALKNFKLWETQGLYPTEVAALKVLGTLPAGACVLDFGCSSGRLLSHLLEKYQCFGIEVNNAAAKVAEKRGIRMLRVGQLPQDHRGAFDAVIMIDVYEHLTHPIETLNLLRRVLKAQGMLILVTGDGDFSLCRQDPGQFWYFRNIEHLGMMTTKHAEYIAELLELKIEHLERHSHYSASLWQTLVPLLKQRLYWLASKKHGLLTKAIRVIPGLRRASSWTNAPGYCFGRDHMLLAMRAS